MWWWESGDRWKLDLSLREWLCAWLDGQLDTVMDCPDLRLADESWSRSRPSRADDSGSQQGDSSAPRRSCFAGRRYGFGQDELGLYFFVTSREVEAMRFFSLRSRSQMDCPDSALRRPLFGNRK